MFFLYRDTIHWVEPGEANRNDCTLYASNTEGMRHSGRHVWLSQGLALQLAQQHAQHFVQPLSGAFLICVCCPAIMDFQRVIIARKERTGKSILRQG